MGAFLLQHPKLIGLVTWIVSVVTGIAALILADFGAPAWVFVVAALWLWTAGLPTLLTALLVFSSWGDLPVVGRPPLGVAVASVGVLSLAAQVGCAVLLSRILRRRWEVPA